MTGLEKNVIEAINRSFKSVLAVDIPSGINGDSGRIMGTTAVRANKTVTFGYLKPGRSNARRSGAGDLQLIDIGLPDFSLLDTAAILLVLLSHHMRCGAIGAALGH